TTTLYSILRELATGAVNIMTVEDPVEYELPGATQIQVEPRRGVTFASALRAILRQDPDVILIGEIRDLETGEIAVQASLTGHLVLATLHTNDAIGVITRLHDLGLDRGSVAESLRGCVAQRLVRRLCTECAEDIKGAELTATEASLAKRYGVTPPLRAKGCDRCGRTGYRGRIPVLETAVSTPEFVELVTRGASTLELTRAAVAGGMRPMVEGALERVRDGTTTLEEIERALGEASAPGPAAQAEGIAHVLVVDDDAVVRTMARFLLAKNGFRISEAADGVAALERLAEGTEYDLMVLDLDMPKLGGHEVLRRVRASTATAALPVVVLTGADESDAQARVMEEGADDYIRKPLDPARFVARIKAALRRAGT
ncbi:MAG: Flp pilus assembly complex ATPase component TadA, partial [Gemmatimonadetes bacterium]|nr:Flp pilus assembly complex ATPase component TadA [Gemmatimonadota bacterium]